MTSCLHAAEAVCRGVPLVDARQAAAISEPAAALYREIRTLNLPQASFWRHLFGHSLDADNERELVDVALLKTVGRDQISEQGAQRLATAIYDVKVAAKRESPNLVEELELRCKPLREQWEARGPGLMREAAQWSDARILVPRADVLLVQPVLGGGGEAHLAYNSFRIEAVMVNPHPSLPEVVRFGWMLSQLNLDLPVFSEIIHGQRLPYVAQIAMMPLVLKAAEVVELAECNQSTLELALSSWRVATPLGVDAVDVIWQWWRTYLETRPPWHVALAALDRMHP